MSRVAKRRVREGRIRRRLDSSRADGTAGAAAACMAASPSTADRDQDGLRPAQPAAPQQEDRPGQRRTTRDANAGSPITGFEATSATVRRGYSCCTVVVKSRCTKLLDMRIRNVRCHSPGGPNFLSIIRTPLFCIIADWSDCVDGTAGGSGFASWKSSTPDPPTHGDCGATESATAVVALAVPQPFSHHVQMCRAEILVAGDLGLGSETFCGTVVLDDTRWNAMG